MPYINSNTTSVPEVTGRVTRRSTRAASLESSSGKGACEEFPLTPSKLKKNGTQMKKFIIGMNSPNIIPRSSQMECTMDSPRRFTRSSSQEKDFNLSLPSSRISRRRSSIVNDSDDESLDSKNMLTSRNNRKSIIMNEAISEEVIEEEPEEGSTEDDLKLRNRSISKSPNTSCSLSSKDCNKNDKEANKIFASSSQTTGPSKRNIIRSPESRNTSLTSLEEVIDSSFIKFKSETNSDTPSQKSQRTPSKSSNIDNNVESKLLFHSPNNLASSTSTLEIEKSFIENDKSENSVLSKKIDTENPVMRYSWSHSNLCPEKLSPKFNKSFNENNLGKSKSPNELFCASISISELAHPAKNIDDQDLSDKKYSEKKISSLNQDENENEKFIGMEDNVCDVEITENEKKQLNDNEAFKIGGSVGTVDCEILGNHEYSVSSGEETAEKIGKNRFSRIQRVQSTDEERRSELKFGKEACAKNSNKRKRDNYSDESSPKIVKKSKIAKGCEDKASDQEKPLEKSKLSGMSISAKIDVNFVRSRCDDYMTSFMENKRIKNKLKRDRKNERVVKKITENHNIDNSDSLKENVFIKKKKKMNKSKVRQQKSVEDHPDNIKNNLSNAILTSEDKYQKKRKKRLEKRLKKRNSVPDVTEISQEAQITTKKKRKLLEEQTTPVVEGMPKKKLKMISEVENISRSKSSTLYMESDKSIEKSFKTSSLLSENLKKVLPNTVVLTKLQNNKKIRRLVSEPRRTLSKPVWTTSGLFLEESNPAYKLTNVDHDPTILSYSLGVSATESRRIFKTPSFDFKTNELIKKKSERDGSIKNLKNLIKNGRSEDQT